MIGGDGYIGTFGRDSTGVARAPVGIDVFETGGAHYYRCALSRFVRLNKDAGYRLQRSSLRDNATMRAIEFDGRRLYDVGSLPESRPPAVTRNTALSLYGDGLGRDVHGIRRGKQRAVGFLLEFAVGGLYVALGKGISGTAIDAQLLRRDRHAAFD